MRRRYPVAIIVIILLIAAAAYFLNLKPGYTVCSQDNEIDAKLKSDIEKPVFQLLDQFNRDDNRNAYQQLHERARDIVSFDEFTKVSTQLKKLELKNVKIEHTYLFDHHSAAESSVCGAVGDLDKQVTAALAPHTEQAYVLVSGEAKNNSFEIISWVIPDNGIWRVTRFDILPSGMAGKSYRDIWTMARIEHEKHHDFNAYLLYATAYQFAARGPNFIFGTAKQIANEMAQLKVPENLKGKPPFIWKSDSSNFKLLSLGSIGIEGKIYLLIIQEVDPASDKEVDSRNRELIAYLAKIYPEYKDFFAGVVVRAVEKGTDKGFGTVDKTTNIDKVRK